MVVSLSTQKEEKGMGFRYRKSINLGGGFRITLSGSGVSYSWGVKGYRVTKTARGTTRRTVSIPGTGISYVHETREGSNPNCPKPAPAIDNNYYDTQDIVNNVATDMVSDGLEDLLASASEAIKYNTLANVGCWITAIVGFVYPVSFLFTMAFLLFKVYVRTRCTINLDYDIELDQEEIVYDRINPMIEITECEKVWRIIQTSKVLNRKYACGANDSVNRTLCKVSTKIPFPFKTDMEIASFKAKKETLLFLPDRLFIMQKSKIGALNYDDIEASARTARFIEDKGVPKDSRVVGKTWKYVNKAGGPDKRFKDNKQYPICLYGELELRSASGLNTVIMFSNPYIGEETSQG